MRRDEYISRMKRYAAFCTVRGVVENPETRREIVVVWRGLEAYPYRYQLGYTSRPEPGQVVGGKPVTVHHAVLRLADTLTELTVPLAEVEGAKTWK